MRYKPQRVVIILGLIASLFGCPGQSPTSPKKSTAPKKVEPKLQVAAQPAPPKPTPAPIPQGKAEAEKCAPKKEDKVYVQSDCASGLVCAPNSNDLTTGNCRVSCGELVKGKPHKIEGKCTEDRTCQIATSLSFDELGAYCLPQQKKRDGACSAMGDDQACTDGRICAVTEVKKDETGKPRGASFVCRNTCAFGTPKAAETCSAGEKCTAYQYDNTTQNNEKGEPVMCTESKCKGDFAGCECDRGSGFNCNALIPGFIAFCERPAGICTTPVGFAAATDFSDAGFSGPKCNEIKGHAFCDNGLSEGVENAADSFCLSISEKTGDGFCYALCSVPAVDLNGDGQLTGRELGTKLTCPANHKCNTDLGRMIMMVAAVGDKNAKNGKKACDPAKCQAGKPCPSECGLGDAECLTYPSKSGAPVSFCGAPFGNCEPAISPK